MRRILMTALVSVAAAAAFAQAPAPTPQAPSVTAGDPAADTAPREASPTCLRHTGSRIVATRNARQEAGKDAGAEPVCVNASGRSYSRDDLERTGRTNVADALRMLDPSVN